MTADIHKFEVSGIYINTELNQFGESLLELINIASQLNRVELRNLKFITGVAVDVKMDMSLKDLVKYKIPFFDYFVFMNLPDDLRKKIIWNVDTSRHMYSESQIAFSVLYVYFMVITRNKASLSQDEKIPAFLMKFMTNPMSIDDIKDCLSLNDLNLFTHNWVKDIKTKNLSIPLKNRFKQGIAGMRLFSIFRDYEPDKSMDASITLSFESVRSLSINGPFWEMHNLFQGNELASMSINANLQNLILDSYKDETIQLMVKHKSLFKYPIYNNRHLTYKTWGASFVSLFKTKLVLD
jgi:hypothetical protein